jgi:hypothetical protein
MEALIPAARKECAACLDKAGRVFGYPQSWFCADGEGDDITAGIWLDALADIPLDLLADAVDRYINAVPPNRWFPKPGELRALCAEELQARRAGVQRRLRTVETFRISESRLPKWESRMTVEELAELHREHGLDEPAPPRRPEPVSPLYVVDEIPDTIAGQPWRARTEDAA